MKPIIVVFATILFLATVSPASASQPSTISPIAAYTVTAGTSVQPRPSLPFDGHDLEIPLLGFVLSGLLFGVGRVWGK